MAFDKEQPSYKALRDIIAERTSSIVAWVGSGLSAAAGIPTWPNLKESLLCALAQKETSISKADQFNLQQEREAITRETNYWIAFQRLHKALGQTSYRDTIREVVRNAASVNVPVAYRYLWRLRISGLLNLNIDRLATKALSEEDPTKGLTEFHGRYISSYLHVLKSSRQFIANLHGISDNVQTWVFTNDELAALRRNKGYQTFLKSCLTTKTVLFLGISADDQAVGGHFEALSRLNIDIGTHYWVTDRRDLATDRWAEKVGIRIIRYEATNGDHSSLNEFFEDLLSYVPPEGDVFPIVAERSFTATDESLSPEELSKADINTIRIVLNAKAKELINNDTTDNYKAYEQFCAQYDKPIYHAWYMSDKPGGNTLFCYKLEKEVARGAFGRVFRARDSNNCEVAIKVLLEEVRNRPDFMQSFRRGVRSMRILAKHNVMGMVAYKEASEIPAFVVMDWIDGPNLNQAVKSKQLQDWHTILRIAVSLAETIGCAHHLPERVLHRDLRPSNVILRGFHTNPDSWDIVVLDFDLSWHRGAIEKSVVQGSSIAGYLAPEQLQQMSGVSTRHAAVDSFGIGMTLFFIIAERDPLPAEHCHTH